MNWKTVTENSYLQNVKKKMYKDEGMLGFSFVSEQGKYDSSVRTKITAIRSLKKVII